MCRLFGMTGGRRRVHATFWLLEARDSPTVQSHHDADGTGLGYYERDGRPVVHRLPLPAYEDRDLRRQAQHP